LLLFLPSSFCLYLTTTRTKLQESGQQDISLLLVAVAKLLAVCTLLAPGPVVHLRSTNGNEEGNTPVSADNNDTDPCENLEHVVGASDETEAIADGDLALSAAAGSQGRQVPVNKSVTTLGEEIQGGANGINDGLVGLGGKGRGAVDDVGAEGTGKDPVEEAVLEDVAHGHGVGGELVDKERLILALEEVQHDQAKCEPLGLRHVAVGVFVEVWTAGDGGEVEEDRAEVFDDEDGSPCNLGACFRAS
jgi:hypothetical protein